MGYRKSVLKKRISAFKEAFPGFRESEKGNLYYLINEQDKEVELIPQRITKANIARLGESRFFTIYDHMVMITQTGKVLVRHYIRNKATKIKALNYKFGFYNSDLHPIIEVDMIGRKYEWMKSYKDLWMFDLPKGFSSLKEFKVFLGFGFISDKQFLKLKLDEVIKIYHTNHQTKVNYVNMVREKSLSFHDFLECIRMYKDLGLNETVPTSGSRLRTLHNELSNRLTLQALQMDFSKECAEYKGKFIEWANEQPSIEVITQPSRMIQLGISNQHCLATYINKMGTSMFLNVDVKDMISENGEYQAEVRISDRKIVQFRGKRNKVGPYSVKNLLQEKLDSMSLQCIKSPKVSKKMLNNLNRQQRVAEPPRIVELPF